MDLYGRLVELQGMTHLLINDVNLLKVLGREAFAEQHRRLLIELTLTHPPRFIHPDTKKAGQICWREKV